MSAPGHFAVQLGQSPAVRAVIGVKLHVLAHDGQAPQTLVFRRSESLVVNIGRRSGSDAFRDAIDGSDVLFRCPVISRKHAKISFSENGNAYITDLSSHHGTHILKPCEAVSRPLEPQNSTVLVDGDRVTFGKSVGRDDTLVRPVTAQVELILAPPRKPMNAFLGPVPFSLREFSSPSPRASARDRPAGSFGMHIDVDASSEPSSSSSSEHDSDIEEVPPPTPAHPSAAPSESQKADASVPASSPSFSSAMNFFKRILPARSVELEPFPSSPLPASVLTPPPVASQESIDRRAQVENSSNVANSRCTSPMDLSSPSPVPSPLQPSSDDDPFSASWMAGGQQRDISPPFPIPLSDDVFPVSPQLDAGPMMPPSPSYSPPGLPQSPPSPTPARSASRQSPDAPNASQSRDSPSPSWDPYAADPFVPSFSPPPAGGQHHNPDPTPASAGSTSQNSDTNAFLYGAGTSGPAPRAPGSAFSFRFPGSPFSLPAPRVHHHPHVHHHGHLGHGMIGGGPRWFPPMRGGPSPLREQLEEAKAALAALSAKVEEHAKESRQRVEEGERRTSELEALNDAALRQMREAVQRVEDRVQAGETVEEKVRALRDDNAELKKRVDELEELIHVLNAQRFAKGQETAATVDAVEAARAEAIAAIEAHTAALQSSPLKRKRSDCEDAAVQAGADISQRPKRRRVRRVVRAVVQTTAVASIAAVATWSALAFS